MPKYQNALAFLSIATITITGTIPSVTTSAASCVDVEVIFEILAEVIGETKMMVTVFNYANTYETIDDDFEGTVLGQTEDAPADPLDEFLDGIF